MTATPGEFTTLDEATILAKISEAVGAIHAANLSDILEAVADAVAQTLQAGTNVVINYDDAGTGKITISAAGLPDITELVQDTVAAELQAGTGISVTYDDVTGKITIVQSGTGGGGGTGTGTSGPMSIRRVAGGAPVTIGDVNGLVIVDSAGASTQPTVINDSFPGADGSVPTSLINLSSNGGTITVQNGVCDIMTSPAGGYADRVAAMFSADGGVSELSTADIAIQFTYQDIGDTFPGFQWRGLQANPNGQQAYRMNLFNNGVCKITRNTGWSGGVTVIDTGQTPGVAAWWTVRVEHMGNNIKLWLVPGRDAALDLAHPGWQVVDSTALGEAPLTDPGYAGIIVGAGGPGNQHFQIDSLKVQAGPAITGAGNWIVPLSVVNGMLVGDVINGARYTNEDVTVSPENGISVFPPATTFKARVKGSAWAITKTGAQEILVTGDFQ